MPFEWLYEQVGARLVSGCLAVCLCFYLVRLWAVADRTPADRSSIHLVVSAVVFLLGWALARNINYLGEVLRATGLTLRLGYAAAIIPWAY